MTFSKENADDLNDISKNGYVEWEDLHYTSVNHRLKKYYNSLIDTLSFTTCNVLRAETVSVVATRKMGKANPGRLAGNSQAAYDIVERNCKNGWNVFELPPFLFTNNDFVNGAHRFWYFEDHNVPYVPVYMVEPKDGYSRNDVINEIGVKFQERPKGTPTSFNDYVARGRIWVIEQNEKRSVNGKLRKEDRVSQDEVREWVKDIADWETSDRQTKLTTAIYNSTEKPGFLSFFSRAQAAKFLGNNGIRITPAAKDVKGNTVNRLISAMEVVHVHRDFIPLFMTDMEKGIKTRVNFYVNTNNIEDEYAVVSLIQARIKEIEAWITTVGILFGKKAERKVRDHLEYGYRPPHIVAKDNEKMQPVK
tara:strand:- start:256 stop:1344 length:1089 start_codon:yes stop_codon:yes gene_type:complete